MLKRWMALLCLPLSALAGPDGIYEPEVKWQKSDIQVCWERPEQEAAAFTDVEKQEIRDLIQREFTRDRTGIQFVGWGACDPKSKPDVVITTQTHLTVGLTTRWGYIEPSVQGSASMGQGGKLGWRPGMPSRANQSVWGLQSILGVNGFTHREPGPHQVFLYQNRNRETPHAPVNFRLWMTALHEFGHVAGLRHEHARPEALQDPNCALRSQNGSFKKGEPIFGTTQISGPYDPNSIMNYCWLDVLKYLGPRWVHIKDLDALKESGQLPLKISGLKLMMLPRIVDSTLYTLKTDAAPGVDLYQFQVGLSAQDLKAIRCMYVERTADCEQQHPEEYPNRPLSVGTGS